MLKYSSVEMQESRGGIDKSSLSFRIPQLAVGLLPTCHLVFVQSAVAQVTPWVDIHLKGGALFVETEVAGIPGYSLIDTGAQINAINEQFLATTEESFRKGRKVAISGVFDSSRRNTYREVPVTIFGGELVFSDLVEVNIGPPENQLILGAGFLQLLVFQFDYPNQRLRAFSRDMIDLESLINVESKRDPYGGSPIVKVRLNDEKDVWLMIDTGNTGGILLDRNFARKRGWLQSYSSTEGMSVGVNSSGNLEHFTLPSMKIGEYIIDHPKISVPAKGEKTELFKTNRTIDSMIQRRRQKAEGILGYDVLKHFVVTIDYKEGYVHIAPPSSVNEGN